MNEETTVRRCFQAQQLRVLEAQDGGRPKIAGLAVPYNALSEDLGGFREQFKRGAFKESLDGDIFSDVEHNEQRKLGRTGAGTMRLKESAKGLEVEIDVPDTTVGRDTLEEVRNGTLDGMSVMYTNPVGTYRGNGADIVHSVAKADLKAVTLTSFPSFPQTAGSVVQRSLDQYQSTLEREQQEADEEENAAMLENQRLRITNDEALAQG